MPTLGPAFLTIPRPHENTLASVARKVHLLALRRLATQPSQGLPGPLAESLRRLQAVLLNALESVPAVVLGALRSPDVLTHLLILEAGLASAQTCLEAAIPPLIAGLAGCGALGESVLWPLPLARLVDGTRGRVFDFDPPARALLASASGIDLHLGDGSCLTLVDDGELPSGPGVRSRRPFHVLAGDHPRLWLSEIDGNPLAMIEAHPEKSGNTLDLGGRPVAEWVAALAQALELVRVGLPTWYGELSVVLQRIVPVGYDAERHLSASYREAPGVAYVSLHPDPLTLAEAIVHETQHSKLNLLSWLDPVLHNGYDCWTSSPVRPDLRPLMGVLMAVHAFIPVAALHRGLTEAEAPIARTERFVQRRADVLGSNARGLEILQDKAAPTVLGRRLLDDLQLLHDVLAAEAPARASSTESAGVDF
jgi:HEXXH motif-containing protein